MIVEHNVDEKSNQSNIHAKGKKMKRFLDLRFVQEISNQSNTCKERKHLRFEAYLVWLLRQCGIIAVYFEKEFLSTISH